MDLTKKSMKWLVAVFVVFAMLLTAVFAVGNVAATASATENEYDSAVHVWATDSAELGTYPNLVVSNAARTITVKYGFAIDAASAEFFNGEFAPVLNGSKPSAIALNSAFTGIVDIEDETDAAGEYLASTGAAKFFTIQSKANADISALNAYVNDEFDADKYLFSATYVLPAEATGTYTLSFASATIGNTTLPSAYALSDSESYLPVIENPNFAINAPIAVPTPANVTYTYDGTLKTFQWSGTVDPNIAITGDQETDAGEYTVTVSLLAGYVWDDEGLTSGSYTFPFVINRLQVNIPEHIVNNTYPEMGDHLPYNPLAPWPVTVSDTAANASYYTPSGDTYNQDASETPYDIVLTLNSSNYEWTDGTTEVKHVYWYIDYLLVTKPTETTTTYYYSPNTEQTYAFASAGDSDKYTVTNNKRTNAGSQTVTVALANNNYKWADGTTADLPFTFTIKKLSVIAYVCELVENNTFPYTGEEITCNFILEGQTSYLTMTGHKQTNVGTYDVTQTLNDPNNYKWSHFPNVSDDEPTAPYVQYSTFAITKKAVAIPTAVSGLRYTGSEQTGVNKVDGSFYDLVAGGTEAATAVGNYTATYTLKSTTNSYWAGNVDDVANKTVNWSIGKAQITKPTIEVSEKVYNGSAQTYSGSGTGYTFTGSGTNFGTYPVTVTLTDKDNTEWNDSTTADYQDADKLSIAKKSVTLTITKSASSSDYGSSVATITVSASGLIAENDLGTLGYQAKYSNGGSYVYYTKAEFEGTNPYPVAKDYILEPVYTANDNYYVSANSSPYTINKKSVTIAFSKASYTSVYGEPLEEISIAAYGLVNAGDLGTISYVIMQNQEFAELVNVGQYSLVNTYTANPNYTIAQAGYATYTITTKQVTKPAQDNTTFTYNGSAQTYTLATNAAYTITGDTTKTNAGSNDITIALVDKTNTEWTTGGTADVVYTFTINKKAVTLDFYDSTDDEPWHLTFVATYPDSLHYITVKATGLIGANDLGELGFTATNDETHAVADITVAGAPAGYYTLTPTYTPNANYDVTALQGTARIYERAVIVPVVVTDTYYYDGTAKAIVFDDASTQGYSQYYTITGNSLTEPGTTTVTVALKDEYAGNVVWGYDARVDTIIDTTDDQTFTLTVNSSAIHVTFTCSYGEAVTTIAENVEVNFVTDTIRALPNFRFFYTPGWKVGGEGDVVTAYTLDMDGATLNAQFTYNVGAGDVDGNGIVNTLDLIKMKRYYIGLETETLADAAAAWTAAVADSAESPVLVSALDANGSGAFRINDLVTIREALATGYDFRIVIGRQGVTGQSIENVQVLTVYEYDEFVAAVKTGIPVKLGDNITAEDERFNETIDIPVDIDLNGKALTVEYFGLNSNANDVTFSIKGGTIYAFDDIVITAPNGNVKLDNVTGYNYVTDEVILAAASNSLHFDRVVEFLKYPEDSEMFASKIAALNAIAALSSENEQEQAAAVAEFNTATKAEVSIPVDTHVVVEENASLEVKQITVVAASNQAVETKTFSVSVKNDQASVIKVNISEVKEVVEQVNVYHVDEVALEGDTSKVEIVKAADQEVATVAEDPTYTVAIDNGTSIVFYEDFDAAVAAVQTGETIVLLDNITYGTSAALDFGTDIFNIDLNGKTFTNYSEVGIDLSNGGWTASAFSFSNATPGSDVSVKNGTIVTAYGAGVYADDPGVTLTLDNVTINASTVGTQSTAEYSTAVRITYGSTVIINSGTYTAGTHKNAKDENAKVLVVSNSGGNIVVNGGTFSGALYISSSHSTAHAQTITINGGTFTNFSVEKGSVGTVTITGGTFDHDPSTYVADGYEATEDNGIWTVDKAYVARIGETKYETFDAAVEAVENGGTIVLLSNITYGTDTVLDFGTDFFSVDLNGYTFTTNSEVGKDLGNGGWTASAFTFSNATPGSNVTISNGTIVTAYGAGIYADDPGMNVTLDNLTINASTVGTQSTAEYSTAVRTTYGATVIINSGTYTAGTHKNANEDNAKVLVVSNSGGNIVVNGGTFSGALYISSSHSTAHAQTITINGGTFTNFSVEKGNVGTVTIYGGTFDADPSDYVADGYVATEDNGIWTVDRAYAAQIGNTKYETFDAAVEAVENGGTIVLLSNITYGTDKVLDFGTDFFSVDLNGYTFTTNSEVGKDLGNGGWTASAFTFSNATPGSNVTISNGTIRTAYGAGVYADDPGMNVTLDNLTINASTVGTQSTAEYSTAVRTTYGATVTINGGTYTAGTQKNASNDNAKVLVVSNSGGNIVVNGGTFSGALYISSSHSTAHAQTITINGGTFTNFSVEKGTYGTISITGGTFDADPSAYLAEGYVASYSSTKQTWTVKAGGARINDTYYLTLKEAVLAAQDGDTVVVMTNHAFTYFGYAGDGDVTIDLNGHALTTTLTGLKHNSATAEMIIMDSVGTGSITSSGNYAAYNANSGTLTINSGTFNNSKTANGNYYAVVNYAGGTLNINGGTFTTVTTTTNKAVKNNGAGVINISGGNFVGGVVIDNASTGSVNITGGTFDVDPSAYVADGYEAIEDNGIWTVDKAYVARIGETKYETLDAAVAAAQNGDTIVLLRDLTFGTDRAVPVWSKSFNIDLNGYTFTTNSTVGIGQPNAGYKTSAICCDSGSMSTNMAPQTFSNGTVVSTAGTGIYAATRSNFTLSGLTVTACDGVDYAGDTEYCAAVRITEMGTVTITSGSYSGYYSLVVSNSGGAMIVNGGTFNGKIYFSNGTDNDVTKTITITGGTFRGVDFVNANKGVLTITGGTFDADPSAYVPYEYGVIEYEEDNATVYEVVPATFITTKANWHNAVNNNNPDGKVYIKLNADITGIKSMSTAFALNAGKTAVLDLNGHNLISDSTWNSNSVGTGHVGLINVEDNAKLTIKDTVGGGSLTNTVYSAIALRNSSNRKDPTNATYAARQSQGIVIIEGGAFSGTGDYGTIFNDSEGGEGAIVYIKGGTFTGNLVVHSNAVTYGSDFVITGGSFDADPSAYAADGYEATQDNGVFTVRMFIEATGGDIEDTEEDN